jgi:hypothetical protein
MIGDALDRGLIQLNHGARVAGGGNKSPPPPVLESRRHYKMLPS